MDCIKYIPNACLAAIVIVNLISLFKRVLPITLFSSSLVSSNHYGGR